MELKEIKASEVPLLLEKTYRAYAIEKLA